MIKASEIYEELDRLYSIGKTDEIESFLIRTMDENRVCCGKFNPVEITVENELGRYYSSAGNLAEAEECFETASKLLQLHVGESSVEYGLSIRNLAQLQRRRGKPQQAKQNIEDSLRTLTKAGAENTNFYAMTLVDAAISDMENEDFATAYQRFSEAAELAERTGAEKKDVEAIAKERDYCHMQIQNMND